MVTNTNKGLRENNPFLLLILLLFMFNHQPMVGIERLFIPQIAIAVEYLTASSVIILVSLAITRIPYMDRIFRI